MEVISKKIRVLVADDDEVTREALGEVLREEGYDVALAADGLQAVALLPTFRPDVVLTDLSMPGLGGVGVVARVRELTPLVPVFIITAHSVIDAEREARELGVQGYLNKPLSFDDMLEKLTRLITPAPANGAGPKAHPPAGGPR